MGTSRRQFFQVTAGGLVAASGVVGRVRPAAAQGPTVKIGSAVLGDYSMVTPILVALEKGFFKAQGVTVEFQPFRGGPDLVKAVVAGQIHIGTTGATDVPVFRATGAPIRFIASGVDHNHFTLNVAPAIGRAADLKGKSKILLRFDTVTPKWISQAYYATDEYIKGNKDAIQRALKGLIQGVRFMQENTKEAAKIASKTLQWTEEAILRAHQISGPLLSKDGTLSVEAIEAMQTTLLEYKVQDKRVPTADLYTAEFTPVRV